MHPQPLPLYRVLPSVSNYPEMSHTQRSKNNNQITSLSPLLYFPSPYRHKLPAPWISVPRPFPSRALQARKQAVDSRRHLAGALQACFLSLSPSRMFLLTIAQLPPPASAQYPAL